MRNTGLKVIAMSCVVLVAVPLFCATTRAADYILVVAVTPPGVPSQGDCTDPVTVYRFTGTGQMTLVCDIPGCPTTDLNDPAGIVFSASGELFVGNRHGNLGGGQGSITRFTFDADAQYAQTGVITGNGLEAVHGLAFSPQGELFAADLLADRISRFMFDQDGNAIPNGTIASPPGSYLEGLVFSVSGELLVTTYQDISRYLFDDSGNAIPNGTIPRLGNGRLHMLTVSPLGEMFVPDVDDNIVYRYLFDDSGNAIPNGSVAVPNPVSVTFSAEGELFVVSSFSQIISRFLFDANGQTVPNGTVTLTRPLGGVGVLQISP